ncbi:flavodoxin [Agathobacter rectalis]|uniref:flavodoxin n=1 Tax=Agathobacter rectalis TaxID=39491 RepID=UPI0027D32F98|nr:flavodoxin [Agathobacter rectalis]
MKTKKIAAVLLTCIMAIGLTAGCGASNTNQSASNNDSHSTSTNQSGNEESDTNSENTTDTTGNGKTLVVYYSASGNTKDVAEKIAKITEADLFEIEPVEPYTDDDLDWTDDDSRVSREHDDESLRDVELVSTTVDNWDSYDTVYIGYPIWWGIAAWPVDNFVKENDFTGKTVIPFCTAATSGIGDSGNLLEEMTGTGDWKEGERFHGGASESDISSWIDSLGL